MLIESCIVGLFEGARKLPHFLTTHRVQGHTRLRYNGVAASELAKRGQDGLACLDTETRQTQAVTRWALQLHGGMQVAGQHSMTGVKLWVVAGGERAHQMRLIDHAYV